MSGAAEGRGAFGGFIGPRTLVGLVENTAPWLFAADGPLSPARTADAASPPHATRLHTRGEGPSGYLELLRHGPSLTANPSPSAAERTDYFALCLAAHFATVTTYVPTDVDTKIRDALWFDAPEGEELRRMAELTFACAKWDVSPVSRRLVPFADLGPVSGHDGERLSVLCGAHLGLARAGDQEMAERLFDAIDAELRREAAAFEKVLRDRRRDRELCILAAHLTHNVGDVDQGLSAKPGQRVAARAKEHFGRLAHERPARYGGTFAKAAAVYRDVMAPEGHRHYPLRELRALRTHPDLLLPISPFLDAWGERLATWSGFDDGARGAIVAGLVEGCRKVPGQEGYYRALAGFDRAHRGGLGSDALQRSLPASVRRELKDSTLRRKLAVPRESFESSLSKRARKAAGAP